MDFRFTAEQELFRAAVRDFVDRECTPEYVRECDEKGQPPFELYRKLAQNGWLSLCIPEEYGGCGGGAVELMILYEELSRGMVALTLMIYRAMVFGGQSILNNGTEEQKRRYLPGIAGGELMFALGLTEPGAGSDAASIITSATPDGDEFVLNGQKMFTSGAHYADYIVVATRTADTVPKHRGLTTFIVDTKTAGLEIRRVETLGIRPVGTNAVFLDNVRVPKENMLGPLNGGWRVLFGTLDRERMSLAAMAVGGMQAVLDDAVRYAQERVQFGQPIGQFQAIQHKLADMQVDLHVSRLLTYHLGWMVAEGIPARKEAAITKLYASEAYQRVAHQGLQIMGGYGYTMESAMQRHFRDARTFTFGGGTSEIQRNVIARLLLGP